VCEWSVTTGTDSGSDPRHVLSMCVHVCVYVCVYVCVCVCGV